MPDTESSAKSELLAALEQRVPPGAYLVAFSGGLDSTVLLHALSRRADAAAGWQIRAVHVNHGLQPAAGDWAAHCARCCAAWSVPLRVLAPGQSPPAANLEAWAREQRYALLQQELLSGEVVLTAHHQRDQAETLLLNLLRGSGPPGLAAMPLERTLGRGRLLRPLLQVAHGEIEAYAQAHQLSWIEDPSNAARNFDRNFLRHDILPRLRQRFPAAERNLARSARLIGEAQRLSAAPQLLQALTRADGGLDLLGLARLPEATRNTLLLAWLRGQGLPAPRHRMLEQIWQQFLHAAADREPCVRWPGAQLRRYRNGLFALPTQPHTAAPNWQVSGVGRRSWPYGGMVHWQVQGSAVITTPQGGEKILLHGHRRRLKQLFQQTGVPPWERRRTPLLFIGGELYAVGRHWQRAELGQFTWAWER